MNKGPEHPTTEILTIAFPAKSRFLSLARLNAASMASSGGFDVDELDDIRLAVGEAIGWLLHDEAAGGMVSIDYETTEQSFTLRAQRTGDALPKPQPDDLVDAILGAILDHHDLVVRPDGERRVELRKERTVVER